MIAVSRCAAWRLLACAGLAAWTLAGCASVDHAPSETFDERTGDTLIVVRSPLDFVRIRPSLDGTRDYVRLAALEEDHLGRYRSWLLAYRWTTRQDAPPPEPDSQPLVLQLQGDDRQWILYPLPVPEAFRGRTNLFAPELVPYAAWAYDIGLGELREMAGSRELTLRLPASSPEPLVLLEDGRQALLEYAKRDSAP